MQVLDEEKRRKILEAAAGLFGSRPFHKVCLADVAAAAEVGKGTLYTYFKGKDDLYLSLVEEGFAQLIDRVQEATHQTPTSPQRNLATIVRELVDYALGHPYLFELMRSGGGPFSRPRWAQQRLELNALIVEVIHEGVRQGEMRDPDPLLTAVLIPGLVRSAMLAGPWHDQPEQLTEHLLRFIREGLACPREEGAR